MLQDDQPTAARHDAAPRVAAQSAWLWLAAFSATGLMALWAMQLKFGARQAQIERQFQARRRAAERTSAPQHAPSDQAAPPARYSTATDTVIGLRPLKFILWTLLGVAVGGLAWRRIRAKREAGP